MAKINLFLMDMTQSDNTSGVDRYVETLLKGLDAYSSICVYWIHFRHDPTILFYSEVHESTYLKVTIPLPQQLSGVLNDLFWSRKYYEQAYRLMKHLLEGKQNCILHLHTLNLIDFAIYIREHKECKIITHLHCIPWKGLYNKNKKHFNQLFMQYYVEKTTVINTRDFMSNYEMRAYTTSDHIVCVTRCAADFLRRTVKDSLPEVSVIPNGINDLFCVNPQVGRSESEVFHLLYAGLLSESKGLNFILQAVREVNRKGYKVVLNIAGKSTPMLDKYLKDVNKDLTFNLLGQIPFEELMQWYCRCDAGIIGSLQEQSSYVAIEMAMFGLPIITTAVDGLDEMFNHYESALKVSISFSRTMGLKVNVEEMANMIIALIESPVLRRALGDRVRRLYEEEMTLERMMQQTVLIYQNILGGIDYE